jgi:hypothetical protein
MVMGIVAFVTIVLVVLATSLFKNVNMSDKAKNLIATVLSVVGAVVMQLTTGGFDFSQYEAVDVFGTVLTVYGGAQLLYNFILKGTQVEAVLAEKKVLPGGGE